MSHTEVQSAIDGVPSRHAAGTPSRLSDAAVASALGDLEFTEVLATVGGYAAGPLGAARVRARRPSGDLAWVAEALALVGEVAAIFRRGDKLVAEPVPDLSRALARLRIEGSVLELSELRDLRLVLGAARLVDAELRRVAEQAPRAAALAVPLPDRAMDRRLELSVGDDGELLDTASPALAAARREIQAARQRLVRRLETILRGLDAQATIKDAGVTVRDGRYVIPVRRDSRSRPGGIVHDESASAGTLFVEPSEAVELGNALREAQVEEEREVLRVLRELTGMLRPAREVLAAAFEMCIEVDDLVARARYGVAVRGEVPEITEPGGPLHLLEARHPLLLARGVEVIPFSLEMHGGERTLLITGPNTGGKTVMLKTTALCALMVQSGIVPPVGRGSALPLFTRVFSDIGDRQSLSESLSTFSGHLASLRTVLTHADSATLVLLDEVGSGTDPAEGSALATAVLLELTRRSALTLATTHLGALKSLAAEVPGIVNGSLQFDTDTLSPTYRFRKGVPGRSYGLSIARRLGLDAAVLSDAESRVSDEVRRLDSLLARAEEREGELERRTVAMAELESVVEALQARLKMQAESQSVREKELAAREKDSDRRARAEAKRYLLDARKEVEAAIAAARASADDESVRAARRALEDAAAGFNRAEDRAPAPSGGDSPSALEPGQRVRLPTGVTGDVLEVRADGRLVVAVGSMRMVADPEGVQLLGRREERRDRASHVGPDTSGHEAAVEVDLRGMTGDEAEGATLAAVDSAVLAEQPFLRIIHGMGTGVVRERVRRVLQRDRRVAKFDFAPRQQGGTGVTIAEFAP